MELFAHSHTAREWQDSGKRSGLASLGSVLSCEEAWRGGGLTGQGVRHWGPRLRTWNISEFPYLKNGRNQICPVHLMGLS